jgi:hypothetical protein
MSARPENESRIMTKKRIGKLPPRYKFMLNPHPETRLSRCPHCDKLTYPRKFPLFIHIDGFGPMVLGKTCKFCSHCKMILCNQDELDAQLAHSFASLDPSVVGNNYMVLGTVETRTWKAGMAGGQNMGQLIDHLSEFKKHISLDLDPGGWRPADADPARFVITHVKAESRRRTPWTEGKRGMA